MLSVSFPQQTRLAPAATGRRVVDTEYFATLVGEAVADRLIRHAGLAADGAHLPQTLDMVTFWRLCAENIRTCNDESHGVAAEPVPCGSLSLLFMAANQSENLGEALRRLSEAVGLIRKECRARLVVGADTVRFTLAPLAGGDPRAEIYVECMMIVTHCALRWMTGRPLLPLRVRGAAALAAMGGEILDALRAPVARRGEGVTLIYRSKDMDAPILPQKYTQWGEAEFSNFVAMLEPHQEAADERPIDRGTVWQALHAGLHSQQEVAEMLGVSVPTLRRRLGEAGLCFRQLSAEFREQELRDLLATPLPMAEIADRLGLSDDRSLRRFCHVQLGVSPRRDRQARELR